MLRTKFIQPCDISSLESLLLRGNEIIPADFNDINQFSQNQISYFCLVYGVYQIPTTELIDFLKSQIDDKSRTIEIGSGNGCIGRALGIRMTDNKMQDEPFFKAYYQLIQQPTILYGDDVIKIDAN